MSNKEDVQIMEKLILSLILMCSFIVNSLAASGRLKEHSISFEASEYKYQEVNKGEEFMNIKGKRYGLAYEYLSCGDVSSFWSYQGTLSFGELIYDGGSQDGEIKFKVSCREDFYQEHRLLYGVVVSSVMPYVGLGFRGLFNRINDYNFPEGKVIYGYDRNSAYVYIPLGIMFSFDLSEHCNFRLNPEFDLFLVGRQITGLDVKGNGKCLVNHLYGGYGFRASGRISEKIGKNFALFFEPFVKYWDIDESEKEYYYVEDKDRKMKLKGYFEPKNNTMEYGAKVGITF
jgi:hypothetical protein